MGEEGEGEVAPGRRLHRGGSEGEEVPLALQGMRDLQEPGGRPRRPRCLLLHAMLGVLGVRGGSFYKEEEEEKEEAQQRGRGVARGGRGGGGAGGGLLQEEEKEQEEAR